MTFSIEGNSGFSMGEDVLLEIWNRYLNKENWELVADIRQNPHFELNLSKKMEGISLEKIGDHDGRKMFTLDGVGMFTDAFLLGFNKRHVVSDPNTGEDIAVIAYIEGDTPGIVTITERQLKESADKIGIVYEPKKEIL